MIYLLFYDFLPRMVFFKNNMYIISELLANNIESSISYKMILSNDKTA